MKAPSPNWPAVTAAVLAFSLTFGCSDSRNLGSSSPHGLLPVDERNPIILVNDGVYDNWQGEYAILLASSGGPRLVGIAVGTSPNLTNIMDNVEGWRSLVNAARDSGISDLPDPSASLGAKLVRPANGQISATKANHSEGADMIVRLSRKFSLPYRPLVVVTGGRLTDVADAYLMDPTVADRTVVVSSMGSVTDTGAAMTDPNGEMDPWADLIVTTHFRFVQVSAFYDQLLDVPASRFSELPDNPFGKWIMAKQPGIWDLAKAADQVAVLSVGLPSFALAVDRVSVAGTVAADATTGPQLLTDPEGTAWLVKRCAAAQAGEFFWKALHALPGSAPAH
jgi:hypothetical protein